MVTHGIDSLWRRQERIPQPVTSPKGGPRVRLLRTPEGSFGFSNILQLVPTLHSVMVLSAPSFRRNRDESVWPPIEVRLSSNPIDMDMPSEGE